MSIFTRSGERGSKDFPLKYYNVHKWDSRFTLGLDAGKNTYYIINASTKSGRELNSIQKSKWAHMSISLQSGARRFQRLICFKYFIVQKWESRFSLELATTFIWSVFWYNAYFWQRWAIYWIYFPIFVHYNISPMAILWAPWQQSRGR